MKSTNFIYGGLGVIGLGLIGFFLYKKGSNNEERDSFDFSKIDEYRDEALGTRGSTGGSKSRNKKNKKKQTRKEKRKRK